MQPHFQDETITIYKMEECGPYSNNIYLVVCPETNESILIDTPADAERFIEFAKTTDVKAILITHNHMDHILGFEDATAVIDAPVGIGTDDADKLPRPADILLNDGDEISAGSVTLKALFTPGHTPGSTCLHTGAHLFSGDTLFPGGPGKSGSPEAFKQLVESVTTKLFTLGDDINVYPGHGGDGHLQASKREYAVFASKTHPDDLYGDVLWEG